MRNFYTSISQKPNLNILCLPHVHNYKQYSDNLVYSLINFLNKSNVTSLMLNSFFTQKDITELLSSIKTTNYRAFLKHDYKDPVFKDLLFYHPMNFSFFQSKKSSKLFRDSRIHVLGMRGIYLNDIGISAIYNFLERNDYIMSLSISLDLPISEKTIKHLLASIRNSKIISCSIKKKKGIIQGEEEQETEKQLSKDIKEVTAVKLNKIQDVSKEVVVKKIIPVLRDFLNKQKVADSETYKYL